MPKITRRRTRRQLTRHALQPLWDDLLAHSESPLHTATELDAWFRDVKHLFVEYAHACWRHHHPDIFRSEITNGTDPRSG